MRRILIVALTSLPIGLQGQGSRDTLTGSENIPSAVRREVEFRWRAPAEIRASGPVRIPADSVVPGAIAVQNGPLVIAGRVHANVTAVNCDVTLLPTARIDGDLWVIGGRLDGRDSGTVRGEIRVYRGPINTVSSGDRLYLDDEEPGRLHRHQRTDDDSWADPIHLATAGAYNRVEGMPINLGPSIYQSLPWGSARLEAYAILRTSSSFDSDHGDVGHDVRGELRLGHGSGPSIGGRLYNTNEAVELWQLSELETSLAAFLFRRDYRDYFARRGLSGFARIYGGHSASLTANFADERWDSRDKLNPFTLFRAATDWRPNPAMDAGSMHVGNLTLRYDTRVNPDDPHTGVFVTVDAEHGQGTLTSVAPTSMPRAYAAGEAISYNRGFIDARSYLRLSPTGQLSFRVVSGGWLSGDQLPLERRLSVEGPSLLPGFDFRDYNGTFDVGSCSIGMPVGRPAECDRVAVAQMEYRGSLHIDIGDWREDAGRYIGARTDGSWVMFADAGRGWMVGAPLDDLTYRQGEFPPTRTFRSDVGFGFDFGGLGLYAAKAVSSPEAVNFFLRLHRRF
jgi:hypothetical protein